MYTIHILKTFFSLLQNARTTGRSIFLSKSILSNVTARCIL
nr:MAG TPA: hypothetical protein [Caudoviricetes sp.]